MKLLFVVDDNISEAELLERVSKQYQADRAEKRSRRQEHKSQDLSLKHHLPVCKKSVEKKVDTKQIHGENSRREDGSGKVERENTSSLDLALCSTAEVRMGVLRRIRSGLSETHESGENDDSEDENNVSNSGNKILGNYRVPTGAQRVNRGRSFCEDLKERLKQNMMKINHSPVLTSQRELGDKAENLDCETKLKRCAGKVNNTSREGEIARSEKYLKNEDREHFIKWKKRRHIGNISKAELKGMRLMKRSLGEESGRDSDCDNNGGAKKKRNITCDSSSLLQPVGMSRLSSDGCAHESEAERASVTSNVASFLKCEDSKSVEVDPTTPSSPLGHLFATRSVEDKDVRDRNQQIAGLDSPETAEGSRDSQIPGGPHCQIGRRLLGTADIPDHMYVALDCEMVGVGLKGRKSVLARCSIVDYGGDVIYDRYVLPGEDITDYRTRWSGIRPEHMRTAVPMDTALADIKACLTNKIVIGHAVYHDFRVLHLTPPHHLVRDTAACKRLVALAGLEGQGNGLKKVSQALLGRTIQSSRHGHCSVEDARASLDLFKLVRPVWEAELVQKWERKGVDVVGSVQELLERNLASSSDNAHGDFFRDEFWPSHVTD